MGSHEQRFSFSFIHFLMMIMMMKKMQINIIIMDENHEIGQDDDHHRSI